MVTKLNRAEYIENEAKSLGEQKIRRRTGAKKNAYEPLSLRQEWRRLDITRTFQ